MFFKNVEIDNFRSISKLLVSDIQQINFFVGKNNCGKTAILEALFLMCAPLNALSIIKINNHRKNVEQFNFTNFFNETKKEIKIINKIDNNQQEELVLLLNKINNLEISYTNFESKKKEYTITNKNEENYTVKADILNGFKNNIFISSNNQIIIPTQYTSNITAESFMFYEQIKSSFEKVIESNQKKQFVEILQKIVDKEIEDISFGANNKIYLTINNKTQLLHLMGDGTIKIFVIILSLFWVKDGVLLIDEIENGIHFSIMEDFLKKILIIAKEMNIQIFATTHNYEILKYLYKGGLSIEYDKNKIKCYTVVKYTDETKAYSLNFDAIENSLLNENEFR